MEAKETWEYIHAERTAMADTLAGLSEEQWRASSWCAGWSVEQTAGHVLAAAEQTPGNFYKDLSAARFRFNVFTDRDAKRLGAIEHDQLVDRLRARTSTTNHPPAPVIAMLGEIIVHGEDIRRPLGLSHQAPQAALRAIADSWKNSNLLIGSKRRIAGVRLRASDCEWIHGEGPEVAGPLNSLILAMTGRKGAHSDLEGDGLTVLAGRA
jgi:uncharacterized protein (TIGR03083 family)